MKMTKRDQILLAVIAAVAVIGGFYWFVIKPAKADLSAQKDELAQIEQENNTLEDTLARAASQTKGNAKLVAERLRLAKAMPEDVETPGVVVQLQRLADRSNVELTSIKTNQFSDYGSIRATEFEVRITGSFFDVDDFLYRLHRQVTVNEKDQPVVSGRLFATTSVDLTLDQSDTTSEGGVNPDDQVVGTVKVLAFSSVPSGAAAAPAAATTAPATTAPAAGSATPAAAPSTTGTTTGTSTTTAPATTTTAPAASSAPGAPQATATPSSGGVQ
jgi:Tfp pilus assembly protein PilO